MIPHTHAPLRWFNDVAQAVVDGSEFIIIAVCATSEECSGLTDWLSCVLPGMTGCVVAVPPCESVAKSVVVCPLEYMLSVHSASAWNRCGDRLTRSLRDDYFCKSLVIIATDEQMATFAKEAPDLISVSAFMRVQPDLPALDPGSPLVPAYQAELKRYEEAYGLSTPEFMRHLFELKDLPGALTESAIRAWQNVAQILRNIDRQP
jgi:hypothetical protein